MSVLRLFNFKVVWMKVCSGMKLAEVLQRESTSSPGMTHMRVGEKEVIRNHSY